MNETAGLEVYGNEERVQVDNLKGPWQAVTILVHRLAEVDTLAFREREGLAYVSGDSPRTRATNVMPRIAAATHEVVYVRFRGRNWKTWNKRTRTSGERFDWLYSRRDFEEWVEPLAELAKSHEVYAMMNNNRYDYAPRSAAVLRGLLEEAGVDVRGAVEAVVVPEAATLF